MHKPRRTKEIRLTICRRRQNQDADKQEVVRVADREGWATWFSALTAAFVPSTGHAEVALC